MDDFSSARPNTKEGASRCPIVQCVRFVTFRVLHHRFMGRLVPQYGCLELLRVSEHRFMGCPIPQCGCLSRFVFHRVPNPGTSVMPTTSTSSAMVVCYCVSSGNARNCLTHALRTPKKNSPGDRPIYHFYFNFRFLRAPLALRWSQAPSHSVISYAPTCAPQVIIYFRCLKGDRIKSGYLTCLLGGPHEGRSAT